MESAPVSFIENGHAELRAQDPGWHHVRAGGRRGSIFVSRARELGYNVKEELNSTDTAVRMLMAGRFDLWFEAHEIVLGSMRLAGHAPEDVVQAWDAALKAMKRDGSFQRIHRKWLQDYAMPPGAQPGGR